MSTGDVSPNSSLSPSVTPNAGLANQVPKYGTVIPNRIFVGGIATNTTDEELKAYFSSFGAVKDTKIICDRAGVSKGYGFVTFETQEDADKIIKKDPENLTFKERRLNIGPAIRKQQAYPRVIDGLPSPGGTAMLIAPNPYGYGAGYGAGLTVMPGTDVNNLQAIQPQVQPQVATNTVMIPQALYMSQPQYQFTQAAAMPSQTAQAMYANQPWVSARCYQPAAATVTTSPANSYLYSVQPEIMYAAANAAAAQPQILEMSDGTMLEQNPNSESDTRMSTAITSTKESNIEASQPVPTTIMSIHSRAIQQAPVLHSFHSNASSNGSVQPPPMKKMTPMPAHVQNATALQFGPRCYNTSVVMKPAVTAAKSAALLPACQTPRLPNVAMAAYMAPGGHKMDEMRMKYEHDGHLAASIAPPTPPSTPASAPGN